MVLLPDDYFDAITIRPGLLPRDTAPADDGLGPARGCIFGMLLSSPFWLLVALVARHFL